MAVGWVPWGHHQEARISSDSLFMAAAFWEAMPVTDGEGQAVSWPVWRARDLRGPLASRLSAKLCCGIAMEGKVALGKVGAKNPNTPLGQSKPRMKRNIVPKDETWFTTSNLELSKDWWDGWCPAWGDFEVCHLAISIIPGAAKVYRKDFQDLLEVDLRTWKIEGALGGARVKWSGMERSERLGPWMWKLKRVHSEWSIFHDISKISKNQPIIIDRRSKKSIFLISLEFCSIPKF